MYTGSDESVSPVIAQPPQTPEEVKSIVDYEFAAVREGGLDTQKQHEVIAHVSGLLNHQAELMDSGVERLPRQQMNVKILLLTEGGETIGLSFHQAKVAVYFDKDRFSDDEFVLAMGSTFPDFQVLTSAPPALADWWGTSHAAEPFLGARKSTLGGTSLWLIKEEPPVLHLTAVDNTGGLQERIMSWQDSTSLCLCVETPRSASYRGNLLDRSLADYPEYFSEAAEVKTRLPQFLGALFSGDLVTSLSVEFNEADILMTTKKAASFPDLKTVPGGQDETVYSFGMGVNEVGFIRDRSGGDYAVPYLLAVIKNHPGGLPYEELSAEINRLTYI